jgi:hypothetical protein
MATAKEATQVKTVDDSVILDIPEDLENGSNTLIVGVNGRVYKLMRGRTTRVPRAVAEVIVNAQEASREANRRIQVLVEQAAKKAAKA